MQRGAEIKSAKLPFFLTMHWAWLLIPAAIEKTLWLSLRWQRWPISIGLFIWVLMQAAWLRSASRSSNAVFWYLATGMLAIADVIASHQYSPMSFAVLTIDTAFMFVWISSIFVMRRDLQRYVQSLCDCQYFYMNGWMTLLFSTFYFQYKFRWIADHTHSENQLIATPALA